MALRCWADATKYCSFRLTMRFFPVFFGSSLEAIAFCVRKVLKVHTPTFAGLRRKA